MSLLVYCVVACRSLTPADVISFTKLHFKPPRMVLAAAGGEIINLVFDVLASWKQSISTASTIQSNDELTKSGPRPPYPYLNTIKHLHLA